MKQSSRGYLLAHLAVLLFGGAGLFGKLVQNISAPGIVTARATFAALFLMLLMRLLKIPFQLPSKNKLFPFFLLGAILAFHWTAFYQSIVSSNQVAVGVLTFAAFPAFTVFLAPLFFKKKILRSDIILSTCTFVGVLIMTPNFDWTDDYSIGILWGIASAASFALLTLLNKKYVSDYNSYTISLFQNGVAALLLLPFFGAEIIERAFVGYNWTYLLILGTLFTAVSHTLFIQSMHYIRAEQASLIANLEPIYGMIAAWILFSEQPESYTLIGGAVILFVALYPIIRQKSPSF